MVDLRKKAEAIGGKVVYLKKDPKGTYCYKRETYSEAKRDTGLAAIVFSNTHWGASKEGLLYIIKETK